MFENQRVKMSQVSSLFFRNLNLIWSDLILTCQLDFIVSCSIMTESQSLLRKHKHFDDEHAQIAELLPPGIQLYKQSENIVPFCLQQQSSQGRHSCFYEMIGAKTFWMGRTRLHVRKNHKITVKFPPYILKTNHLKLHHLLQIVLILENYLKLNV